MSSIAHEWAGLTDPKTGRGVYPGQTTGFSVAKQLAALQHEREKLARRQTPPKEAGAPRQAPSQAFWMERGGEAVARHPYLVGEKGPELFVPHQSGEVIPNNANFANLRAMLTRFASGANFARMRELIANGGAFGHYRAAAVAGPYHEPLSPDLGRYIARRDGVTTLAHKVTGDASLRIDLHGFPKGTKTKSEISGLFKTLTMYRGLAAPMADQEG